MPTTEFTYPVLVAGSKVVVHAGCRARDISKGARASVLEILPGERGSARVRLAFGGGRVVSFYVQHTNRLSDAFPAMNDGNPLHRIVVRRA